MVWLVLVLVALIGTYAAVILPALVGRLPDSTGLFGSIFWTGLLFYLYWKRQDKSPWRGAAIGGALGFLVCAVATVAARGPAAAIANEKNKDFFLALEHFDPAGADAVRRAATDRAMAQRRLQPLLASAIRTASDESILALVDVQQRLLDPDIPGRVHLCSAAAQGIPPSYAGGALPEEEKAMDLAMTQVFRTADAQRQPPAMDVERLQQSVQQVYVDADPDGALQDPERFKNLPPHKQCALYRTVMARIRSLPEAAAVFRYSMMNR